MDGVDWQEDDVMLWEEKKNGKQRVDVMALLSSGRHAVLFIHSPAEVKEVL